MRFGQTLREAAQGPWKDKYIDYGKLQTLLREDKFDDDNEAWTEEDENRFCEEIFNVQLEKVARFQQERVDALKQRADAAFDKLKELAPPAAEGQDGVAAALPPLSEENAARLKELEAELDSIMDEIKALKRYSSINYTGFLKIVKKHDRKRGDRYKVRPMMQLSLAQRPFNSEQGYSPLLNKLSLMYFAIRQQVEGDASLPPVDLESQGETLNGERYTAHKFWVHPDNLLEVKTLILRHLPSLVYSRQAAKELDGTDSPAVTSLYLDNKKFELYSEKVDRQSAAESLRLRWYGQLSTKPDLFLEHKVADSKGKSDESKFTIKDKYVSPYLNGEYSMEKTVAKMERQGQQQEQIDSYKETVNSIQKFQQEKKIMPVLRANYVRTAFQKPSDDRIRVSIDTDLAFIREDTLDAERPCRDPRDWHRTDIDNVNMTYPFQNINQSEVSKFPHAILEIKLKEDGHRKRPAWVDDLITSHLVHAVPRFSKFVHGVASLFEDYVNNLPFWLADLETDIRKDPQQAFEEEEQRRVRRADEAMAVGSLIGTVPGSYKAGSYKAAQSSPVGKSFLSDRMAAESSTLLSQSLKKRASLTADENGEASGSHTQANGESSGYGALTSVFPGLSLSKYAIAKRAQKAQLPEGVVEPKQWIKNAGELKVEPKVWLANERTFLKWQHICILQGALALALYSAAGESLAAEVFGIIYIGIAAFAGAWGYYMLQVRRSMIIERSGKDFDNMVGPLVISVAMMIALIANFIFQYRAAYERMNEGRPDEDMARIELR
ncbi:Phosphate metabolism transcription protein [Lecanicillium sp. MT-2017a]|nr:Phosphate metabolism transcription protein [Lecanicillium sp. MT-2017a]